MSRRLQKFLRVLEGEHSFLATILGLLHAGALERYLIQREGGQAET